MKKYISVLVGGICIIAIAIGFTIFWNKASDTKVEEQEVKTQVPDLIKQLYSASIPKDFDLEEKQFIAFKDGKIELRGPEISMDGTTTKDGLQDVLYWAAQLNTDSNNYVIADFNTDGLEDVAIVIGDTGGGSGYFYHLTIFKNEGGKLKYLTSEYLGDRIEVNKINYTSGIITADIITQGPGESFCCGTTPATLKFRLEGDKLVSVK